MTSIPVVAPVAGRALPLADVPDPVFSTEMVGPGVAIDPGSNSESEAVAPVSGTIVKLHPHAYIIQTAGGAGVLVHLGIDTVDLAGDGFDLHVTEGTVVSAGDRIVTWDPDLVVSGGRSPICPVIALEAPATALTTKAEDGDVAAGDLVFTWVR